MEWSDEGAVLAVRPHGESAALVDLFTRARGRHAGVVPGGLGRRLAPHLQPGAQLAVTWRARLENQTGTFRVEPLRGRMAAVIGDRLALAGLSAVCAMLAHALPERAPCPDLYDRSLALMDVIPVTDAWPLGYLHWELALLKAAGFALDLSRCTVTGARTGLVYVSPRTGRAVSVAGAGAYAPKLLALPPVMLGRGTGDNREIAEALAVTGHFLHRHIDPGGARRVFPPARARLVDLLSRVDGAPARPSPD